MVVAAVGMKAVGAMQGLHMLARGMEAVLATQGLRMAARAMDIMQVMDMAGSDPMLTGRLVVTIVTGASIGTITALILAEDIPSFGEERAFGSGRHGPRRSGLVAFTGDSALASYSCPNGKSGDGTLEAFPVAMFCLTLLFQLFRFPWL